MAEKNLVKNYQLARQPQSVLTVKGNWSQYFTWNMMLVDLNAAAEVERKRMNANDYKLFKKLKVIIHYIMI